MKKNVFVMRIKIMPMGDKNEINRVYEYLRDAMYKQYIALNRYMSEVGTLYYHCNRDISSLEWKEEYRKIFLSTNPLISDIEQPKGLAMYAAVSMKIKQDFSTALKNGLAKGERSLPYYKRDFPIMVAGRFLTFYKTTVDNKEIYAIKFVNKINFKVILGSRGSRDSFLIETLESLCSNNDKYKICGSQIVLEKGAIFLHLTLMTELNENYVPQEGKMMGVVPGYSVPIVCSFNDSDKEYKIGSPEDFIQNRINLQEQYSRLQKSLKLSTRGHGRNKKLKSLNNYKNKEKNYVKYYNHVLSKNIVELAKKEKVEVILLEDINKEMLEKYPVMLRNWSYFQLYDFIKYKAKREGIDVLTTDSKKYAMVCYYCDSELEEPYFLEDENEWNKSTVCKCKKCDKIISYAFNKAKNICKNI